MQQTATKPQASPEVKSYKYWVTRADNARKRAERQHLKKEDCPEYTAANNIANGIFAKLQKIAMLLIFILSLATGSNAQTVTKDSQGNYTASKHEPGTASDKKTGNTYTHTDGKKYDLYISQRGKLYCLITSKTGNIYKKYMPTDSK